MRTNGRALAISMILVATANVSPSSMGATRRAPAPDLILHNAVVISMDAHVHAATAIAIRGPRIQAVGKDAAILALAGPATRIMDLAGRVVLPGFIESHGHWIGDRGLVGIDTAQEAVNAALSRGWTTLNELFVSQDRLNELQALSGSGNLHIRVNGFLPVNYATDRFGIWFKAYHQGQRFGSRFRLSGVKFFIDRCDPPHLFTTEPHLDGEQDHGVVFWKRQELVHLVGRVHRLGWTIAAHTCGDAALDWILGAIARAYDGGPSTRRDRIEHAVMIRDDQLARMRRMRVIASFQLTFVDSLWAAPLVATLGPEDARLAGHWRDLVNGDVRVTGSTDSPFEYPFTDPILRSPMEAVYQAVTKIGAPGTEPPAWMLDQRLSVMQALRLLTIDGAYAVFDEHRLGSITPNKLADLVVLSDDPRFVPSSSIPNISTVMTMVGGDVGYCAPSAQGDCATTEPVQTSSSAEQTRVAPRP
jgi:predicted amidohydrolase YtcJ